MGHQKRYYEYIQIESATVHDSQVKKYFALQKHLSQFNFVVGDSLNIQRSIVRCQRAVINIK